MGMRRLLVVILILSFSTTCEAQLHRLAGHVVVAAAGTNTWDPSAKATSITLSSSNMVATQASGGWNSVKGLSSYAKATGKWYFRVRINSSTSSNVIVGVGNASASLTNFCGSDANGWGYYGNNGNEYTAGGAFPFGASFTTGDTVDVAFDATLGRLWFGKNGTWQAGGNPAANTGTSFTGLSGSLMPMFSANSAGAARLLVTSAEVVRTPPAGFSLY